MAPHARSFLLALAAFGLLCPGGLAQGQAGAERLSDGLLAEDSTKGQPPLQISGESGLSTLETAHAAYLRDRDLQLTRPERADVTRPPPPDPPDWTKDLAGLLDFLTPFFRAVLYLALVIIALALGWFLFGEALRLRLAQRRKKRPLTPEETTHPARPDAIRARGLLDEADALAARGQFGEAVHLLLFSSIEDMEQRLEGGVAPSLTAREIASLARLPETAGKALRPIIRIVESSHFGGRAVDADAWQAARRSYQDFAFGPGWT